MANGRRDWNDPISQDDIREAWTLVRRGEVRDIATVLLAAKLREAPEFGYGDETKRTPERDAVQSAMRLQAELDRAFPRP